ncbi:MAG TPA: 30S ribosomal protein S6 [Gemmatimonadaceae bacterium]|nr:30S ribosomal protein S6 [Gemmatimonadaceae bacterium]
MTKGRIAALSREYEAVYIFDSTLEDAAINEKIAKHHSLLGTTEEIKYDHWGRRQLAYKIGTRETGYYVVAHFRAEGKTLPEFERSLKLDDGVVRYLISVHEHELGAPPMTEEQLAARKHADDDDDDED